MKKFGNYTKWVIAFIFGVALIAVYKTFENLSSIFDWLGQVVHILWPFLTGFLIAYILHLPCNKLEQVYKKWKAPFIQKHYRGLSILTIYVAVVLIFVVLMRMIIPAVYKNALEIYFNMPRYVDVALKFIRERLHIDLMALDEETIRQTVQNLLTRFDITNFGRYAQRFMNLTSGVMKLFVALIVSAYALFDRDHIVKIVNRLLDLFVNDEKGAMISDYVLKTNTIFSTYIYCQLLDAAIIAIMATIVLSLLGVKYALVLGFLMGFCNLIPYFGAIVGTIFVVVITCFTGGWLKALWTGIALLVLQQIDGNFIGPRIMGNKLKLRPLWIIFAVTVGGGLFGVLGMILSVPVLVILKMIVGDYIRVLEARKTGKEK